jgi:tetratricopeptide (TPR) repeat protein
VVAAAALAAHAAALGNGFVFDDARAIVENPVVQGPASWALVTHDFWGRRGAETVGTWRPLVTASFFVDRQIGGGAAWPFHVENWLWHAAAAVLLMLALAAASGRGRWAWLAGVVFAVAAVNSEAVASLVGRADVMAAALSFASWLLWRRSAVLAALAWAAALLCKESAIVTPLWIAAGEWLLVPAERRRRGRDWAAFAVVAVLYVGARVAVVGAATGARIAANNNPLLDEGPLVRLWTACELTVLALRLVLAPLNSAADYSASELMPVRGFQLDALVGAAAIVVGAAVAWRLRRREPTLSLALALFGIAWAPVSNAIVALPTIFAERLLYLPAAGAALAWARLGEAGLAQHRRLFMLAGGLFVAAQLAFDVRGDRMWRDDLPLFAATVEVSPRSGRAWINYGAALQRDGRLPEAAAAFARSLEVFPTWRAESSLGVVLDMLGQGRAAEPHLRRALAAAPEEPDARHNLALFLARHGARAEAAAVLRPMVAAHPERAVDARLLQQLERDLAPRP